MGKRKRRADNNKAPPHSDIITHAPQLDLQSEQRSLDQVESDATQALLMDSTDSSLKSSPGHESPLNPNHSSSHRILLRHSRHPFGRHYSRRSSTNYSDASPSNWRGSPAYDAKLPFKLESKELPPFPYRESRDRTFLKPERIRSSSLGYNAVSRDVRKMECRICQKRLRYDLSVVAVLVCGHAYHADCLEEKTSHKDSQDPPCPVCVSQTSYAV